MTNQTKLKQKAELLLAKCSECQVASVSPEGYPRVCILGLLKANGIKELWFSTGASGTKVRHFKQNPKAGLAFYQGGDSVTLTGTMEIITNKAEKDELWDMWASNLSKHFPPEGKDSPEFCVLKFTAEEGTLFVDNEFETMKI